jgi:hypothetical protein
MTATRFAGAIVEEWWTGLGGWPEISSPDCVYRGRAGSRGRWYHMSPRNYASPRRWIPRRRARRVLCATRRRMYLHPAPRLDCIFHLQTMSWNSGTTWHADRYHWAWRLSFPRDWCDVTIDPGSHAHSTRTSLRGIARTLPLRHLPPRG